MLSRWPNLKIAVMIPCLNEEASIEAVVNEVRHQLPESQIYVYDNASTDGTMKAALNSGAIVRSEPKRGKGNVVRRMFADIEADIFILVDGDLTYDLSGLSTHINVLINGCLDMVIGSRKSTLRESYRPGHIFGNKAFNYLFGIIFGAKFIDIFSGYRVMTCRFVKTFSAITSGFEIETELSVHALELRIATRELEVAYRGRMEGSVSKLNTIRDGIAILIAICNLFRTTAPMQFYSLISFCLAVSSFALGYPLITYYIDTGLVPRVPTSILASALMILSGLGLMSGLILDKLSLLRRDLKRLELLRYNIPFLA